MKIRFDHMCSLIGVDSSAQFAPDQGCESVCEWLPQNILCAPVLSYVPAVWRNHHWKDTLRLPRKVRKN